MKQRDLRGSADRLCALRQDRRTLLVVMITTALALSALARVRMGLATMPAARDHPFRAATVATQGPDEHTAALNDSCFEHHGFQASGSWRACLPTGSWSMPFLLLTNFAACNLRLCVIVTLARNLHPCKPQGAACRCRWS